MEITFILSFLLNPYLWGNSNTYLFRMQANCHSNTQ